MTQEEFALALQSITDSALDRLLNYIDSGNKFIPRIHADGKGHGCILGVIWNYYKSTEIGLCPTINKEDMVQDGEAGTYRIDLVEFNNNHFGEDIMYKLIRKEAERRGMIKKELEPTEQKAIEVETK